MNLPELNTTTTKREVITSFRGYNHRELARNNELYNMENLTSDLYPLISVRKERGYVRDIVKPNGILGTDALCYVDGTDFYYNGEIRGTVEDSEKQLVKMGAYILIWPDKKYYNTQDDEFGVLEAETTFSTKAKLVSIQTCNYDGSVPTNGTGVYAKLKFNDASIISHFNQHDGVEMSGWGVVLAPTTGPDFSFLNTTTIIQNKNDKEIIISLAEEKVVSFNYFHYATTDLNVTISRKMPDMDYIIENENRIWGCSSENHEVYSSKLGDPKNWNSYEGISTDSYTATIGSAGDFTGIGVHLGYVMFFKENIVHKMYGTKPSNFQLYSYNIRGVKKGSYKSIAVVNETLFYHSPNGIVAYDGNLPVSIYEPFGEEDYHNAVSARYKDKYYVSMKDKNEVSHMFAYDTEKGLWHREDNTFFKNATTYQNNLYYTENSSIKTITGNSEETIKWIAEFGDSDADALEKQTVKRIDIRTEIASGARLEIYILYDSIGKWERIYQKTCDRKQSYNIPVIPRLHDNYKVKLSGIGDVKIYAISKILGGV